MPVSVSVAIPILVPVSVSVPFFVAVFITVSVSISIPVSVSVPLSISFAVSFMITIKVAIKVPVQISIQVPVQVLVQVSISVSIFVSVVVSFTVPFSVPVTVPVTVTISLRRVSLARIARLTASVKAPQLSRQGAERSHLIGSFSIDPNKGLGNVIPATGRKCATAVLNWRHGANSSHPTQPSGDRQVRLDLTLIARPLTKARRMRTTKSADMIHVSLALITSTCPL
ncbi:hypothetical protein NM208_g9871 [Fusarium decemcellulare]|uniref:Uncharacterized protein n=1 Tax=Fusarium decemcellulare TaxID=57161 RepID=A0ACC1RZY6_9HYPO|nr:hypothetical protein NM208_g9871 [Fusarium decemcellulare]